MGPPRPEAAPTARPPLAAGLGLLLLCFVFLSTSALAAPKPGDADGFEDEDVCPDQEPDILDSLSGVVRGIDFQGGSAVLRSRSRPVLQNVADLLVEHDHIALTVIGHPDDRGDHDANVALSAARAAAVTRWLASRGVDASRLHTEGRGPDQPLEPNDTDGGRSANRRVELNGRGAALRAAGHRDGDGGGAPARP